MPFLSWLATVWTCPLELKDGNREGLLRSGDPQGSVWFQYPGTSWFTFHAVFHGNVAHKGSHISLHFRQTKISVHELDHRASFWNRVCKHLYSHLAPVILICLSDLRTATPRNHRIRGLHTEKRLKDTKTKWENTDFVPLKGSTDHRHQCLKSMFMAKTLWDWSQCMGDCSQFKIPNEVSPASQNNVNCIPSLPN